MIGLPTPSANAAYRLAEPALTIPPHTPFESNQTESVAVLEPFRFARFCVDPPTHSPPASLGTARRGAAQQDVLEAQERFEFPEVKKIAIAALVEADDGTEAEPESVVEGTKASGGKG